MINEKKGAILILSGPSGCGKSTLLKEVYKEINDFYFSISTTTRAPRSGEKHGVDYFFVSREEFEKDIEDGYFLEYAEVHGNYYGTSLKLIEKALNEKKLVIFDIDVQGHEIARKKLDALITSVFITTPSLEELENRLVQRATDEKDVIEKRIKNAKHEINYFKEYDYLIINNNLEVAAKELISIANAVRIKASLFEKEKIVSDWMS